MDFTMQVIHNLCVNVGFSLRYIRRKYIITHLTLKRVKNLLTLGINEARRGIEPLNKSFADSRLTAWLPGPRYSAND